MQGIGPEFLTECPDRGPEQPQFFVAARLPPKLMDQPALPQKPAGVANKDLQHVILCRRKMDFLLRFEPYRGSNQRQDRGI
jgi:hypothetical protein